MPTDHAIQFLRMGIISIVLTLLVWVPSFGIEKSELKWAVVDAASVETYVIRMSPIATNGQRFTVFAQTNPQASHSLGIVIVIVTSLLFWGALIWGVVVLFRYIRKREQRSGGGIQIPLGTAGLILVFLRLLEIAKTRASDLGDFYWFVGTIGIMASGVGLVVSIIAIFKNSGRIAGVIGVVAYVLFALLTGHA